MVIAVYPRDGGPMVGLIQVDDRDRMDAIAGLDDRIRERIAERWPDRNDLDWCVDTRTPG